LNKIYLAFVLLVNKTLILGDYKQKVRKTFLSENTVLIFLILFCPSILFLLWLSNVFFLISLFYIALIGLNDLFNFFISGFIDLKNNFNIELVLDFPMKNLLKLFAKKLKNERNKIENKVK
jgi:hypothetical protein